MALPSSRQTFKDYCLRRLGAPVIDINVDDEQVEDRINDALIYFREYHHDGVEKVYLQYQLTEQDITNKYVTLPDSIIGVTSIFDINDSITSSNIFNVRYQIHLNDLYDFSFASMAPYVMAMRHIETLQEVFNGKKPIRYNKHMNKLFVDLDWSDDVQPGKFIVVDCYRTVSPDEYPDIWTDRFLAMYATALIKRQWGENLKKFEGMALPGNITFNGQKIWDEADAEVKRIEELTTGSYSLPVFDMIG
jgi:hypothetical protein